MTRSYQRETAQVFGKKEAVYWIKEYERLSRKLKRAKSPETKRFIIQEMKRIPTYDYLRLCERRGY